MDWIYTGLQAKWLYKFNKEQATDNSAVMLNASEKPVNDSIPAEI